MVAATKDRRRAALACMTLLVVSDPKASSALHTRKRGQIDRAHQASPESATLRSLSERLTLVTAVTGILLRHGCKIPRPPYSTFMVILLLILFKKNDGYGTSL